VSRRDEIWRRIRNLAPSAEEERSDLLFSGCGCGPGDLIVILELRTRCKENTS